MPTVKPSSAVVRDGSAASSGADQPVAHGVELPDRLFRRVAVQNLRLRLEDLGERPEGDAGPVREAPAAHDARRRRTTRERGQELDGEAALSDAGLAVQRHEVRTAVRGNAIEQARSAAQAPARGRPAAPAAGRATLGGADRLADELADLDVHRLAPKSLGAEAPVAEDGAAATVRWPTRIWPGSASCCTRAATLTASPVTMTSPRRGAVVETTSPLLMPILTSSSGLPSPAAGGSARPGAS